MDVTEVRLIVCITTTVMNLLQEEDWAMNYQCLKYGPVWRLVGARQDGILEEVVVSFQGIIYKKDIAPFNPKKF